MMSENETIKLINSNLDRFSVSNYDNTVVLYSDNINIRIKKYLLLFFDITMKYKGKVLVKGIFCFDKEITKLYNNSVNIYKLKEEKENKERKQQQEKKNKMERQELERLKQELKQELSQELSQEPYSDKVKNNESLF